MMRARYSMALATGTVAAAGTIGALIPPSILFIIYGVIAQEPISQLFLGGAVVGVLTAIAYILTILIWTVVQPDAAPIVTRIYTLREKFNALWGVIPIFLLAGSVFGGLFGGIFTPTEAGAVGSGIAVLIAFFKRTLTWNTFRDSITEAFVTSSALFLIAVGANLLSRFVALSGAGDLLSDIVLGVTNDPFMLMILIVIVYLVLGMFLDPIGAMLITLPVLLPIAEQAQFNLIWFGVIVAKLLEIGMITPPVGLNVFIIKSVVPNSITLTTIFKGVLVFLVADLVVVLLIMLFPEIVLFLPNLMQ